MTFPIAALNTLITNKLAKAPPNTVSRGCRVAMIAAIKNVLSPISETRIKVKDCMSASVMLKRSGCVTVDRMEGGYLRSGVSLGTTCSILALAESLEIARPGGFQVADGVSLTG
jgi:hypothetical protein